MSDPTSHIDTALLTRLAAGEAAAFSQVYDLFYQRVLFFARRFVTEADAEDVTAEAFIQLWRKRGEIPTPAKLSSFLFVAARNRCFDLMRHEQMKAGRQEELIKRLEQSGEPELFTDQVNIELVRLLRAEIDQLPKKMRQVFLLSYLEGMKPAGIADVLGIHVKTVSNQKLTAVKLLRQALEGHSLEILLLALLSAEKIFT